MIYSRQPSPVNKSSGSLHHAFGSSAPTSSFENSDIVALDKTITERRHRLQQLRTDNQDLKDKQSKILEDLRSGKLRGLQATIKRVALHPTSLSAEQTKVPADSEEYKPPVVSEPKSQQPGQFSRVALPLHSPPIPAKIPQVKASKANGIVTFKSQTASRYLSVITLERNSHEFGWVRADADEGASIKLRGFQVVPVDTEWVALKSIGTGLFVEMIPQNERLAWVVRATGKTLQPRHHFRLEGNSKIFNRESQAYINVIEDTPSHEVRGHGNSPRKHMAAAYDDFGTNFEIRTLSADEVRSNEALVQQQAAREHQKEEHYIAQIKALPKSQEKRVVSYGLYGSNPKYTTGAIRNSELVHKYFPGWVCRFYCDKTVPDGVVATLRKNGAEVVFIENIKGGIAGMFWRFLVADDPTVDRWIVRDSDSRLNPRERFAVEEWIQSGKVMHTIRDHPNHERPMNGGLIGGTKHAIPGIRRMIDRFPNKNRYGGDLSFLTEKVWPMVKDNQIAHDAYTCHKFPNSRPFPTKRPDNYQHVGQVFLVEDNRDIARMGDINGFMKGREVPMRCRGRPEWKYG